MSKTRAKPKTPVGEAPRTPVGEAPRTPVGEWLKAARLRRNTTQAALAQQLNTEQSMLAMIEDGSEAPGPDLLAKIRTWIRSGHRPSKTPKRGPYQT